MNGWCWIEYNNSCYWVPYCYLKPVDLKGEENPIVRLDQSKPYWMTQSLSCLVKERFKRTLKVEPHIVTHTYEPSRQDEINIDQGAVVEVLEKNQNGWWKVRYDGRVGIVPALYLTPTGKVFHDLNINFSGFGLPQRTIEPIRTDSPKHFAQVSLGHPKTTRKKSIEIIDHIKNEDSNPVKKVPPPKPPPPKTRNPRLDVITAVSPQNTAAKTVSNHAFQPTHVCTDTYKSLTASGISLTIGEFVMVIVYRRFFFCLFDNFFHFCFSHRSSLMKIVSKCEYVIVRVMWALSRNTYLIKYDFTSASHLP